jgi:hypothetical protein
MPLYIPYSEELRLRGLKAERKTLWKRFEENPSEIQLAAKLKIIDDQIAQPYQQNDSHDNKLDDSEVTAVPEVGGIFLLLALSQRKGSQTRLAHSRSRNSASERASHGPPTLAALVSSDNATTTAHTAMLSPHRTVEDSFREPESQKMASAIREAGLARRGRNQRKACRVDQKVQFHNRSMITQ